MKKIIYIAAVCLLIAGLVSLLSPYNKKLSYFSINLLVIENLLLVVSGSFYYLNYKKNIPVDKKLDLNDVDSSIHKHATDEEKEEIRSMTQDLIEKRNSIEERAIMLERRKLARKKMTENQEVVIQ